jgi:predicted component of type VI protein secretion system
MKTIQLASMLETALNDAQRWREAALQADELSNHLSDAINERNKIRSNLEKLQSVAQRSGCLLADYEQVCKTSDKLALAAQGAIQSSQPADWRQLTLNIQLALADYNNLPHRKS